MGILDGVIDDYPLGSEVQKADGTTGALSDTVDLKTHAIGLMLNTAGAIKVMTRSGAIRPIASGELALNVWHPMRIRRVYATDTTLTATQFRLGYGRY